LPAILDEGRVLGSFVARWFAVVAHNSDDLVGIFGVQRDQTEVVCAVDTGEMPCLLFR
jgi:hypothetical protein